MSADDFTGTWAKRQRLAFIEETVRRDGRINRSDLEKTFDVSTPTASTDFSDFEAQRPGAIRYDTTAKAYVAGPNLEAAA